VPSRRPATGPGRPPVLPAGDLPAKKIPSSEPTYAAYKRPAPLLAAPHPSRELPVVPNRTATPPFAPPPPTSTIGRPLPRRHLLKPSLTKVSTGIASPRSPPPFPPVPGRRRPLDVAARRRTEAAPASLPCSGSGEEEGHFCPKPPGFPFCPEPFSNPIHPLSLLLQNSPYINS
jgi:hypothetical protein